MATRLRFLPAFLAVGMTTALIAGCNIFGFTSDTQKTPLEKAEDSIRDGNYAQAKMDLTDKNGVLQDSTNSMVLYTYSKAVLLESGLTIARIVDLVQANEATDANKNLKLLGEIDKQDFATQTAWYRANQEIASKLARIWMLKTSGGMQKSDIALDYSISNILGGVLSLRDTNRDGAINGKDFQINLAEVSKVISGSSLQAFDFNGITAKDETTGQTITFQGLTAFLGSPLAKRAKPVGVSGYSPDNINDLIATFLSFLEGGDESIRFFVENLAENTSYDPEEIMKFIPKIAQIINFYWYDDGIDNDKDGRTDEEAIDGVDNDGDGQVDEDSHFMASYDTSDSRNTQYIPVWQKWSAK